MASISIRGLTKVYETPSGPLEAVSDLDLEISEGEFVVFVGPSGCGKTTTLRCLAGLEDATKGTIELDGKDITNQDPSKRDTAMVFQSYALYSHMTVRQNISFNLKLSGQYDSETIDKKVTEVAEMLGIEPYLDSKPGQLSGGQQQRVALGRAVVREPSVFLFDEPLSNLDAKLRTEMRTELEQLQRRLGITSVYVTHDQTEAMTMGDRICILDEGALQQVGTPHDVYNHPSNRFVAGFIGDPSMNFWETEIEHQSDSITINFETQEFEYSDVSDVFSEVPEGTCTVGVRPEDIAVQTVVKEGERSLTGEVIVVETLGNEHFVHLDVAGEEIIARTEPTVHPEPGDTVSVWFEYDDVYLFDSDTGDTIKTKSSPSKVTNEIT